MKLLLFVRDVIVMAVFVFAAALLVLGIGGFWR
jgi:hypothetical protein